MDITQLLIAIGLLCGQDHAYLSMCARTLTACMLKNEGVKKSEPLDLSLAKCVAGLKE